MAKSYQLPFWTKNSSYHEDSTCCRLNMTQATQSVGHQCCCCFCCCCCADVDECDVREISLRHKCAQLCENTIGSYLCVCQVGFTLADNGLLCEGRLIYAILGPWFYHNRQKPEGHCANYAKQITLCEFWCAARFCFMPRFASDQIVLCNCNAVTSN